MPVIQVTASTASGELKVAWETSSLNSEPPNWYSTE